MKTLRFSFLKDTKNFDVFRELDSEGNQFPDDWEQLRRHKEQHTVGSIYVRKGTFDDTPDKIEVTIKAE